MKTKKSLGQNFFINKNLSLQITNEVLQNEPDIIVEIGPGTGSFTNLLNKENIQLLLIEKDRELIDNLSKTFPKAVVLNEDFLEWGMEELDKYKDMKILFFGSLPYNVSKPIIRKIIESKYFKHPAYFIIQKEVAQKYTSREPENNLLSLEAQLFAVVKKLINISPDSFKPRPKVNSSFVSFSPQKCDFDIDIDEFKKFLNICFKQPRKTLKNNLKKHSFTNSCDLLLQKRPQHLSIQEYIFLFSNLDDHLI
jgi:16S rRNA (adenine1518-N6/adenine1519-N6)-dimethyltransferase